MYVYKSPPFFVYLYVCNEIHPFKWNFRVIKEQCLSVVALVGDKKKHDKTCNSNSSRNLFTSRATLEPDENIQDWHS